VTHPFHPLSGQEYVLANQYCSWGEDRVFFHGAAGRLQSLPAGWTSLAPPDPFNVIAAGRSLFRFNELLALAKLLAEAGGPIKTPPDEDGC